MVLISGNPSSNAAPATAETIEILGSESYTPVSKDSVIGADTETATPLATDTEEPSVTPTATLTFTATDVPPSNTPQHPFRRIRRCPLRRPYHLPARRFRHQLPCLPRRQPKRHHRQRQYRVTVILAIRRCAFHRNRPI